MFRISQLNKSDFYLPKLSELNTNDFHESFGSLLRFGIFFFRFESLNSRFSLLFMLLGASTLRIQRYEDSSMTVTKKGMLGCWTGRVFCGSSQINWLFGGLKIQMASIPDVRQRKS